MKEEFCPQCPRNCSKEYLKCGRGKAYFGVEDDQTHNHDNKKPLTGIAGLLKQCGHIMHHNPSIDNNAICKGLSTEEQKTLEDLLNKLLLNIK